MIFDLSSGFVPVEGTTIDIDYKYYLSRIDIVMLDKTGEVEIVKGIPDDLEAL